MGESFFVKLYQWRKLNREGLFCNLLGVARPASIVVMGSVFAPWLLLECCSCCCGLFSIWVLLIFVPKFHCLKLKYHYYTKLI